MTQSWSYFWFWAGFGLHIFGHIVLSLIKNEDDYE